MLIKITKQEIDSSARRSCINCPIANALKRAGFRNPFIANNSVYISGDGELTRKKINLPDVAINFITNFDSGYPVEEFEFDLDLTVFSEFQYEKNI